MGIFSFLKKQKKENLDYESTLNSDLKARDFNGDITLLIIADTHGSLALNKDLQKKVKDAKYDLCCVLGDIHDYDYKFILETIPKEKIVALLGNHDRYTLLKEYGIEDLNGRVIEFNNIKIGGIQGSFKYKDADFPSFTHKESIDFMNNMESCDILLSHDKPFVFDYKDLVHDGLKGITKYLYDNQVPINIHGHIHDSYESKLKNNTLVKGVYLVEIVKLKNGKNW